MSVKDKVLEYLELNRGGTVSGGALASEIGVSRNAVFKAVNELRDEGYDILSSRGGYTLSKDDNKLSAQGVVKYLPANKYKIHLYNTVASTNGVVKEMAEHGAPEWTVAVAEGQTAGRGRLGRTFVSPAGTGIYLSVLLRPELPLGKVTLITVAAAVAAVRSIEKNSGKNAEIKWVNDVYIGGKKVCGILTEASLDAEISKINYAVLGVGINVAAPRGGFDGEAKNIAAALCGTATAELRSKIIADFLSFFSEYYESDLARAIPFYREKQYLVGRRVEIVRDGKTQVVDVLAVDENCALIVKNSNGQTEKITSGDVSVHAANG